jgi:hypothetical protein
MSDAEEIRDALVENAQGPRTVTTDAGSATAHSLMDQIAAEKHVGAQAQASSAGRLVFNKLVPPGAS